VLQEQHTYLPEEQAIRTKSKFDRKTDYEQNMDTSMPHTTRAARTLHTHTDKRTVRLLRHARECKTIIDILQ